MDLDFKHALKLLASGRIGVVGQYQVFESVLMEGCTRLYWKNTQIANTFYSEKHIQFKDTDFLVHVAHLTNGSRSVEKYKILEIDTPWT